jgi:dihydrofolate synthase/folylpolyglutamate synthase
MNYKEAYSYINSFTNYEQVPGLKMHLKSSGLQRFERLIEQLGNPHKSFKSIIIAGTKGKGSAAAMIDSVLRVAGHKTGLYTSPHLHTFRERIRVNGQMIPPADLARMTEKIKPLVDQIQSLNDTALVPTTYELSTAIAFLYFQEMGIDIAVLEVGMGGRLDATNVVDPLVSVITSISMDHTEVLGDTLEEIAGEKAGIIKQGVPVVSAPQDHIAMGVIAQTAKEKGANLTVVGREVYVGTDHLPEVVADEEGIPIYQAFTLGLASNGTQPEARVRLKLPLLGNHQQVNAAVALAAIGVVTGAGINAGTQAIVQGFSSVSWPGRMEVVNRNPVVMADGAHNVESISRLGQAMAELFHGRKVIVVLGIGRDKDIEGIVGEIAAWQETSALGTAVERVIVTHSRHPRAADTRDVAQYALNQGLTVEVRDDVGVAIARAQSLAAQMQPGSEQGTVVLVTGSLFVVAEAREYYGLAPDLSEEESDGA